MKKTDEDNVNLLTSKVKNDLIEDQEKAKNDLSLNNSVLRNSKNAI
jgi:hypothetical protein